MTGLDSLTIHDPSRAVLWLLPEWLGRLSDSLTRLHLLDNCGSVTPGVLRSLAPPIRERVRSFALGISYSLTDDDVLDFLSQIPDIRHLDLRYYFQLKAPLTKPRLIHLRSFTVRHHSMFNRFEARFLCKWIRRIISSSPIETLRLISKDSEEAARQAVTLRFLDLGGAFVGLDSLRRLLGSCVSLEELHVASGEKVLRIFAEYAPRLTRLHTASFDICNVSRKKARAVAADEQLAGKIIRGGSPSLRRLVVNDICWEV
ncbi:hypothetical protein BD779DRAFT_1610777 [Infundibulicybe gibba]|nr:hypothetical protein BD779DRAFT_1610777 [Infundibulicybe gibba]